MGKLKKEEMVKKIDEAISSIKEKKFNVYFYVLDTKGNPASALEYIYQTALILQKKGYNVTMLHQEDEFVGVKDWLGEEYANLKHLNVKKDNVEISPCDFIFIPEIFANVMMQVKKLPCKKVIIVQNASHICEFMPVSQNLDGLNIIDAIVTTEAQKNRLVDYFPEVRPHIVSPSIKKIFRKSDVKPQKLIVNIICKDQSDVNKIVKPFYWKNPLYKWISFRDLRGLPQELFATALQEAAFTIWADDVTPFGYTLLEALRSGTIVLAKVPNEESDWMIKDNELTDSVLWFNRFDDISEMFPTLLYNWLSDSINEGILQKQEETATLFSEENQEEEIAKVYEKEIFERRMKDFEEAKVEFENNAKDLNKE